MVRCCGSCDKLNTYFLRSFDSNLFFREWIFKHANPRGFPHWQRQNTIICATKAIANIQKLKEEE